MLQKKKEFGDISLSFRTWTEGLGINLFSKLKNKYLHFSIRTDENSDFCDIVHLLIFIRKINSNFNVSEELA